MLSYHGLRWRHFGAASGLDGGALAPAGSCAPGIRKLRLECTWSPFWNLFVSPRRGGRGEVGRGEGGGQEGLAIGRSSQRQRCRAEGEPGHPRSADRTRLYPLYRVSPLTGQSSRSIHRRIASQHRWLLGLIRRDTRKILVSYTLSMRRSYVTIYMYVVPRILFHVITIIDRLCLIDC